MSDPLPKCVTVYGALRSGTTLLRLMLDQNTHLRCPGEADFLLDHLNKDATDYDMDALLRNRIYLAYCDRAGIDPAQPRSLDTLIATMAGPQESTDKTIVLMVHRNLTRLLAHQPQMKILHLIRDPRDVARSSIGMGWAGSTYYGIRHWLNTERNWASATAGLPTAQVLPVKYETLIEAPQETLTAICDFFGVPFQPAMLEYDTDSTYSKPDPAMTYQWRRKQTPREIGLVEAQVGPLLGQLGYEPSGHPAVHPGFAERVTLALGQRRATWGVKFKRFGVKDPLLVMLARRLRLPALGHAAQRRIDAKAVQYLK